MAVCRLFCVALQGCRTDRQRLTQTSGPRACQMLQLQSKELREDSETRGKGVRRIMEKLSLAWVSWGRKTVV